MNNIVNVLNTKGSTDINVISKAFIELKNIEQKFLDRNDYVNIKWKVYIKKSWFRKLWLILWISTEIVKHDRIEKEKYFIHEYTIRATASNSRYTECSWACASNERTYNHIENDVIATAQTRASSRAISDLLGIWEIFHEETNTNNNTSNTDITNKQKNLLIKLVESKYQDEQTRNNLYKKIDTLNKQEATTTIKQLIEEWVEI